MSNLCKVCEKPLGIYTQKSQRYCDDDCKKIGTKQVTKRLNEKRTIPRDKECQRCLKIVKEKGMRKYCQECKEILEAPVPKKVKYVKKVRAKKAKYVKKVRAKKYKKHMVKKLKPTCKTCGDEVARENSNCASCSAFNRVMNRDEKEDRYKGTINPIFLTRGNISANNRGCQISYKA